MLLAWVIPIIAASAFSNASARERAPRRERLAPSGKTFCRLATSAIARRATRQKICVVFDVDNTLVDTRHRTKAALKSFGLRRAPIRQVRYDGNATASSVGLRGAKKDAFERHWERFFWNPDNFRFDKPIRETVEIARRAKAAGAEVFYLTGRIERLKKGTVAQLSRLGLPDADAAHVLCKPNVSRRTARFKRQAMKGLLKRYAVSWFMSDAATDLSAVRGLVSCVAVKFPVNPAGAAPIDRMTPSITVR